jgi:hypothetical protein
MAGFGGSESFAWYGSSHPLAANGNCSIAGEPRALVVPQ